MRITFDPVADAVYVALGPASEKAGLTDVDDQGIIIDRELDGSPRGYEFLNVSTHGLPVEGLPVEVSKALKQFEADGKLTSTRLVERTVATGQPQVHVNETHGPLVRALQNLAAEPKDQAGYLASLEVGPLADELALEYDDALISSRTRVDPQLAERLDELGRLLADMSGATNEGERTTVALAESPRWVVVREVARSLLKDLDVP